MTAPTSARPHRRLNPLTGEHLLVSPHSHAAAVAGQRAATSAAERPAYDPACFWCPATPASVATSIRVPGTLRHSITTFLRCLPPSPLTTRRAGCRSAVSDDARIRCVPRGVLLAFAPRREPARARGRRYQSVLATGPRRRRALSARRRSTTSSVREQGRRMMGCQPASA